MLRATFYFRGVRFTLDDERLVAERDGVTYSIDWTPPNTSGVLGVAPSELGENGAPNNTVDDLVEPL